MNEADLEAFLESITRKHFPGARGNPADGFEASLREALKEAYKAGSVGSQDRAVAEAVEEAERTKPC